MDPIRDPAPDDDGIEIPAGRVARRVPSAQAGVTAGELRRSLPGKHFQCATDVAVLDGERLAGVLPIERLLAAPEDKPLGELMDRNPPAVHPGTIREVVAWKAVRHRQSSLPVVNGDGRFLGFIPARDLLSVLLKEHHEDLARLSGMGKEALSAETSLKEPILRRLGHRLPWLLVGLGGALASADLVAGFEEYIRANVILAFFLPAIVYLADAVGTQTETLVVRGLSVRVPMARLLAQELLTGLLIGVLLGLVSMLVCWLRWGIGPILVILPLSLLAACVTATMTGIALPWLLRRMGKDPAFGSGPLATVIQDLLSILIFLAIAALVLR